MRTATMRCFLAVFFLSFTVLAKAQTPIDVVESTFKVPAFEENVLYYGFAEGDQVMINFEEVSGKELKEFEVMEMPGSSKFMEYKVSKIANKNVEYRPDRHL